MNQKNHPLLFWLGFFVTLVCVAVVWLWNPWQWSDWLLPSPPQLLEVWREFHFPLQEALLQSSKHSVTAWFYSLSIAIPLGFLVSRFPLLSGLVAPILIFLQIVPLVALAPFVIISLGFNEQSIIFMAAIVCFFSFFHASLEGFRRSSWTLQELITWLRLPSWASLVYVDFPRALPYLINSFKPAWGLALVGSTVAEFLLGQGLGSLLEVARAQNRVDLMIWCLIYLFALGSAGHFVFTGLKRLVYHLWPWD
jgi:NitT/TauT family transport system permease protein